jgi:hypothetical protein
MIGVTVISSLSKLHLFTSSRDLAHQSAQCICKLITETVRHHMKARKKNTLYVTLQPTYHKIILSLICVLGRKQWATPHLIMNLVYSDIGRLFGSVILVCRQNTAALIQCARHVVHLFTISNGTYKYFIDRANAS